MDLMGRLGWLGREASSFPGRLVTSLPHGDAMRVRFHEVTNPAINILINELYRQLKTDLLRQATVLDEPSRRDAYAQTRNAARSPEGPKSIDITFRAGPIGGRRVLTSLRYQVEPRR